MCKSIVVTALLFGMTPALPSLAQAACPNASPSVTIPLSGTATVVEYDQNCNVLPAGGFTVWSSPINGSTQVTATTTPAVVADGSGLHFSANSAAPGTAGTFKLTYNPNGQTANLSYTVGAPVTAVSFGTTTP